VAAPVIRSELADAIRRGLLAGATVAVVLFPSLLNSSFDSDSSRRYSRNADNFSAAKSTPRYADFGNFPTSPDALYLANWIADSADNAGSDFLLIDKKYARVLVFDARARLRATSPILLGGAVGDDAVPGIGNRPLDQVKPAERTTPAGRFMGERGRNARGEDVVWVDYDAAVSMHRVLTLHPEERRLERLASETVADNRVSWGCINVPVAFYETQIRPIFADRRALIYVLPEVKPLQTVFYAYDVQTKYAQQINFGLGKIREP
jgi:hypothetical protein